MKTIILIGGMPTAGKSTLAAAVSERLGLPWMSTDHIRTVMRTVADREKHADLSEAETDGNTFLSKYSAQEIADMEYMQSVITWKGIAELIRGDYTWNDGFIIEGVNILPSLVHKDFVGQTSVKSIFVGDHNEERIRNVVFNRGLWGPANTYSDEHKEKEIEWVLRFSERIKNEADTYGYPWLDIEKNGTDVDNLLSLLELNNSASI